MRLAFIAMAAVVVGCSSASSPSDATTPASTTTPATTASITTPPPAAPPASSAPATTAQKDIPADQLVNSDGKIDAGLPKSAGDGAKTPKVGDQIAILNTSQGRIVVKFFPQKAPNHVKNFVKLAGKKFYDGTKFHRVIPGFMIQGGDPNTKSDNKETWGQGGPGYNVKAEFNDILHTRGILSMARTGDPDGAGSQFFIMHAKSPSLDGQYSVFGQVIEGMDVVDKIVNTPTEEPNRPIEAQVLKTVTITKWPITLKGDKA